MRAVGIKMLKNRLSEFIRLAAGGETILVLDRDRVVAELNPPGQTVRRLQSSEDWKERGVREGWLTLPSERRSGPPRRTPMIKLADLLADLEESRSDRDIRR